MNEREILIAPCGLDCGICELYTCRNDRQLLENLVSTGIPESSLPCKGCKPLAGKCPLLGDVCATYSCSSNKGHSFCSECSDFPCMKLAPSSDRANILPHNTKVFNLCTIKRDGIDAFIAKARHIKDSYYAGKIVIGEGPVLDKKPL